MRLLVAMVMIQLLAGQVLSAVVITVPPSCDGSTCGPSTPPSPLDATPPSCDGSTCGFSTPASPLDDSTSGPSSPASPLNVTPQLSDVTPQLSDATPQLSDAKPQLSDVTPQLSDVTPQLSDVITPPSCDTTTCALGRGCLMRQDTCRDELQAKPVCVSKRRPCSKTWCPPDYTCAHIPGACEQYGDPQTDTCHPKPHCVLRHDPCAGHNCSADQMCQPTRLAGSITATCITPPCHYAKPSRGFRCENQEAVCCERPCSIVASFVPS